MPGVLFVVRRPLSAVRCSSVVRPLSLVVAFRCSPFAVDRLPPPLFVNIPVRSLTHIAISTQNTTRLELLQRAVQTHTGLTRRAVTGRGIDRHLLGLRLMLRPEAGESHALFEDDLFTQSQTWKLSTSGLSAGYQFRGTG